jgi:hypothetical protein
MDEEDYERAMDSWEKMTNAFEKYNPWEEEKEK